MNNKLTFENLNDLQSTLITLIPYIDINENGIKILKQGGTIKINELFQYLETPDYPYFGKLGFDNKGFTKFDSYRGKKSPLSITDAQLFNYMIEQGLGDLLLTNIKKEQGFFSSGFNAYALKDNDGNIGISYCGSHFDATKGAIREWLEANVLEYFIGSSTQVKQAQEFFDKNKHSAGKTYIYGASLGGNLSQHIYNKNYKEIEHIFTINGNPINQKKLDTQEKIDAFNNPKKASFNIICGDVVGLLKNCDLYQATTRYIKNNDALRDLGGLESHLLEAATYDENNNFVLTTRNEALETVTPFFGKFTKFTRNIRELLNKNKR